MGPTLAQPVSQLCTQSQFDEPVYAEWCVRMGQAPIMHRKQWEFVYIAQALAVHGMLQPSKRGLGFGVGREPLPAMFASMGVDVLATDLPGHAGVWGKSNQHVVRREDMHWQGICTEDVFLKHVSFQPVDMRSIPETLGRSEDTFDFTWSACALDHLGTLKEGLDFIRNSLDYLSPGGVAVHTTEYNMSSDIDTIKAGGVVLYRDSDLQKFAAEMYEAGNEMTLNLTRGDGPLDGIPDKQPYSLPHLCMEIGGYVTTSVGITIVKGGALWI